MGRIFLQSMMGAGVVHIYEVWAPYPCKTVFFPETENDHEEWKAMTCCPRGVLTCWNGTMENSQEAPRFAGKGQSFQLRFPIEFPKKRIQWQYEISKITNLHLKSTCLVG